MDLKSDKGKSLSKQETLQEIKTYCEEQIKLANRKAMDEENFSMPSWSYHQAYLQGFQKAFIFYLIKIIFFTSAKPLASSL